MQDSWKKPAAKMQQPKVLDPSSEESEIDRENREYIEDRGKIDAKAKANEDKIAQLLAAQWFVTDQTFPFLRHNVTGNQMSVSRFYPQVGVAVDIFVYMGDWEKQIIEQKRKLFKENDAELNGKPTRIKYGALSYSDPLANLLPQLEE